MLLYAGLEPLLKKAESLAPKLTDMPIISQTNLTIIYLGTVSLLAEVELKANKANTGWLYNKSAIVFFHHNDQMYEAFISTLKVLAEEKFYLKKFLKEGEEPSAGVLKRDAAGRIVGYLSVEDLIAVSNKIQL